MSNLIAGCDVLRLPGPVGVESPLFKGELSFLARLGPSSSYTDSAYVLSLN